jgi:hypothetical protein
MRSAADNAEKGKRGTVEIDKQSIAGREKVEKLL